MRGGDAAAAESPGQRQQLSPGLLDLHAFDTELIPDFQVPGMYDGAQKFGYANGGGFDDSALSFANNKQMSKSIVFAESNYLKAFPEKEKAAPVAKIKVVVDLTEYVEKHAFIFDAVLDEDVSNDEVYRETVEPVVPAIFNRTKATCFAYGQTAPFTSQVLTYLKPAKY